MENSARQERLRSTVVESTQIQPSERFRDDEINLVDLWLVLAKHKKFILIILGLATVVGVAAALILPSKYSYTTSIEIGTRLENNKTTLIEPAESVRVKIKESYIPLVQNKYRESHPDDNNLYEIKATIPKKSDIIVLTSKGPEAEAETQKFLHQRVLGLLKADHDRIMGVLRSNIILQRRKLERDLEANKEQDNILKARLKRIDVSAALTKKEIKETEELIRKAQANRKKAVSEARDEARAMTLLMLDNEVQQNRERLASLEERVFVDLINQKDLIKKQREDNSREYSNIKDQITSIELELKNLQETRAVTSVVKSIKPTSVGNKLIVVLTLMAGLLVAIIGTFFLEFLKKVKEVEH